MVEQRSGIRSRAAWSATDGHVVPLRPTRGDRATDGALALAFPPAPPVSRPRFEVVDGDADGSGAAPPATRPSWLRAVVVGVVVFALAAAAGLRWGGADDPEPAVVAGVDGAELVVTVGPGDTLWSIAREVRPGGDVRPLVDEWSAARAGAPLQVGEVLELPLG